MTDLERNREDVPDEAQAGEHQERDARRRDADIQSPSRPAFQGGDRADAGARERGAAAGSGVRPDPDGERDVDLVDNADKLMLRWQEVQTGFVDNPREALRTADALVQQVMKQVQDQFAAERSGMEQQWSRGEDVSTEEMRLVLQRYRSFFNRLLKV